jgi:hypothetical protein
MLEKLANKIANLAGLLQLFISIKIAFQLEKVYVRRILKDTRASVHL